MIGKEKERGDLFMNKNLKRALNTTAAVSMSLAMVLGAVNPVNVEAATAACAQSVINGYEEVLEKLENAGGLENLQLTTELEDKYATNGDYAGETVKTYLTNGGVGYKAVKAYYDECATRAEQEEVEKVLKFVENVEALQADIDTMATKLEGAWKDALPEGDVKEARTIYNNITNKYVDYQGNVSDEHAEKLADYLEDLGYLLEDYTDDNYNEIAEKYAEALGNVKVVNVSLADIADEKNLPAKFEKQAEKVLEQITEDKIDTLKEISKYEDVSDYKAVAEIMDALEAAVEAMPEANDLQSTKLDEYKAFKKVEDDFKALTTDGSKEWEKLFDDRLGEISTSDLKTFTEYYETVVSNFYEVEIKERANGDFRATWQNGKYHQYLNTDTAVLADAYKGLAQVVNKDEETTYLDLVLNRAADIEAAIKAVTTDLKGITVNNMTTKDVKAIQAAEEAMIKLAGDTAFGTGIFEEKGEYTNNLTSAQKKEVKNAYRNVKALVDAMYDKGLVSLIVGWVETAQGWEYYDNNGNRVMEGWAAGNGYWSFMKNGYSVSNEWCAANDGWYYMGADGKMVTGKVVIDGVEQDFGTDGIWVR